MFRSDIAPGVLPAARYSPNNIYIIYRMGESGFNCWGVRGPPFVLFLFYVNVPVVSLVLPAFDDTGSLGFPLRQVVYPPG